MINQATATEPALSTQTPRIDRHDVASQPPRDPSSGGQPVRRVLMLTHRLPYPPDRGDRIRSFHMLCLLAKHFKVAVACTTDEPVWLQHHHLLRAIADRVAIQPISTRYSKIRALGAMATGGAITTTYHYRQCLADTILQWHQQAPFDAVLTFCTAMLPYARLIVPEPGRSAARVPGLVGDPLVAANRPIHVLDLVDVDSMKWRSYARKSMPPMRWVYAAEARRLGRIEAGRQDHFDAVTVVSRAEAQVYRDKVGHHPNLTVVGNGVDLKYFSPLPDADTRTIVFVGVLNYKPNAEGIAWFVRRVFGLLRQRVPDAKLLIVGRHPTAKVHELGRHGGVEVVGSVSDVREYLRKSAAVIAPLRIARGVQNKVLEAMASQRAVVCSLGAAKGIDATDGQHLLVADRPEQWVDHLQRVLTESDCRGRIAQAARRHVEQTYAWDRALDPMVGLLNAKRAVP